MSPASNHCRRRGPRPPQAQPRGPKPNPNASQCRGICCSVVRCNVTILLDDISCQYIVRKLQTGLSLAGQITCGALPSPSPFFSEPMRTAISLVALLVWAATTPTARARPPRLRARNPVFAMSQYPVRADGPAGFEAAMQVAYQPLASTEPATQAILKSVVVVLNPSATPDGHERFAAWYNSVAVGAAEPAAFEQREPWSITGRYGHYRFDMNRDLLAQS